MAFLCESWGDKWNNVDFLKVTNVYDFLILCETWSEPNIEVAAIGL